MFLDVGAHIGSVFSAVHNAFPDIGILAVEADPAKAASLRALYPYCTLKENAVGEWPGAANFFIDDARPGYNSLVFGKEGTRKIIVEVDTLDRLFPDTVVDVIKIDIEGAELGALRGATALLERSRPVVMFESAGTGENGMGYSPQGLWRFFDDRSFLVFTSDRLAHDAPPLSLDVFLDTHYYPMRGVNFFAVPEEKHIEVRDAARAILGIHLVR